MSVHRPSLPAAERLQAEVAQTCRTSAAVCQRATATVARATSTLALIAHERTQRYALPTQSGEALVTHCAWCGRTRATSGAWRALPPNALMDSGVLHSHGICAECFERLHPSKEWRPDSAPPLTAAD
jgi:hypothetical protein